MHPVIQKLNWALFQEDKNDFEIAIKELVKLLRSETDYVQQHTKLLHQALRWLENQRQTRYLLTGKAYREAKAWLLQKNELVSCDPSDLHCDFIAQSIKNAHNLMCQAFLSFAEEDAENAQKIRLSLTRKAFRILISLIS